MGLTSPIAECLGAEDETFTSFYDPIVEGMMIPIKPVIDMICIIDEGIDLPKLPGLVAELLLNIGEWILNPLILIELAGFDIPSPFSGFDLSGTFSIDPEIVIPELEVTLGLLTIPLNIVIDWCVGLPNGELPSVPTIEYLLSLVVDLGFKLPAASLQCIAELLFIPMQAVLDAIQDPGSIC